MQRALPDGVVAVVQRGDKILFVQQSPYVSHWGGYWMTPGGAVEPGEAQEEAVARETWEEAGVVVRPVRKVWECLSPNGRWRLHWWLAEYVSGEPSPDFYETSAAAWLTVDEFLALDPILDSNREFFQKVLPQL